MIMYYKLNEEININLYFQRSESIRYYHQNQPKIQLIQIFLSLNDEISIHNLIRCDTFENK